MDSDRADFFYTLRVLRIHLYLTAVIGIVVFVGASWSAIQIGKEPIKGPLVVFLIMSVFYGVAYWVNRSVRRGLVKGEVQAWVQAFLLSLISCLFLIGIPAVRELMGRDVRARFFGG